VSISRRNFLKTNPATWKPMNLASVAVRRTGDEEKNQ
jgi:hypothetical protein